MTLIRLFLAVLVVFSTASCAILEPLFGFDRPSAEASVYQGAMADYSLCETAPTASERAAAATRLSQAAAAMQAETRPTDADHFYEMDRVTAADARCRASLLQR